MGKFTFNTSIGMDMKAASADSFVDNIQMIEFSEIKQNKDNFYTLSELELLADDIERQGLKHNLVVCKDSAGAGYWLISGHRRYSAIKLLIEQNRLKSTLVPCYVDGERTQAEAMLNLIMLNATQRKYTDAETMAEYEMLKQTIQQLEDEGKPVKGRIREIIAKTLNVSPAQVGKIENIRNNAIDEVHEAVKNGEMSISTANEVAKLNPAKQQEIISSKPTAEITHRKSSSSGSRKRNPNPNRKMMISSTQRLILPKNPMTIRMIPMNTRRKVNRKHLKIQKMKIARSRLKKKRSSQQPRLKQLR